MTLNLLIFATLLGCGGQKRSLTSGKSGAEEGRYELGKPGRGWSRVAPGGADRAWFHTDLGASIYVDSNCKARFEDKPLNALITHLTFGMTEGQPEREEQLVIDGRAALFRIYKGNIDGVNLKIAAVVIKKNRCVYDGLYIASPSDFETGLGGFMAVISGLES
jgi:hypothetical protein